MPPHLFDHAAPKLYSIDPGRPFLEDLAAGLNASFATTPEDFADALVLVPTRRAARALATALIAGRAEQAGFLAAIRPLGDLDDDEVTLFQGPPEDTLDLPPAISAMERIGDLARLVAARERAFAGHDNWPGALAAARELGRLLDSFYTEELNFDGLANLVDDQYAVHWRKSLEFLRIVTEFWPKHLAEKRRMDPAARRVALINAQAQCWLRQPPQTPVIIAGTTASMPAVRRLVGVVAGLPKGLIVLPGLDGNLDARGWREIDDSHPQMGMKILLDALARTQGEIDQWPFRDQSATDEAQRSARCALLSLALRPAEATDDWRVLVSRATEADPGLSRAIRGLMIVEAETEDAEAMAIAMQMRLSLDAPGRTALLVTADRALARRVALKMRRWNIVVDDSGGASFASTPCGVFLRLVAQWLDAPGDPRALMALARHPLAGFGLSLSTLQTAVDALDLGLRGPCPEHFEGLQRMLRRCDPLNGAAAPVLALLEPLASSWPGVTGFQGRLEAHLAAAEAIAAGDMEAGGERLWRGADGAAGAALLAELRLAQIDPGDAANAYGRIFDALIAGLTVRHPGPAHPRLAILGPLEARLQSADDIILGGLNEGVWPNEAEKDPFLSRPMRASLGLPSPERRLGLAAHDFAQLAAHPHVILTRAKRTGDGPTTPSRWLVRLQNILAGAGVAGACDAAHIYDAWARSLDGATKVSPATRPAPRPPVEARPRKLPVTDIERWLRDPYAIYARRILRLRKLTPLAEPFTIRTIGSLLHKVFEQAVSADPAAKYSLTTLAGYLDGAAGDYGFTDTQRGLWAESLAAALDEFIIFSRTARAEGKPVVIEGTGETTLRSGSQPFTLTARADRIDALDAGGFAIFDYKAGKLPTFKQEKLFSPQLALTGLIAEAGGFPGLEKSKVARLSYLKILRRREDDPKERSLIGADAQAAVNDAYVKFLALIETFDHPDTPYLPQPRPEYEHQYGDYDLLSRRREWAANDDDGGEG